MNITPVQLESKTVRLEPISRDHVEGLFAAANDPAIWEFYMFPIDSLETMQAVVERALELQEAGHNLAFTVIDKRTERIVGSTRYLDIDVKSRGLEIGWTWYNPSVWRSAINTECKYLLLRHAFEELGCIRVQFKTDSRNVRSQTAITRLGAEREGILRNHMILQNGYIRDSVYFSILDREWQAVKARLENWMGQA